MTYKKYTTIDDLNAIGSLIKDFRERGTGVNLIDMPTTTQGASTQTPHDNPETLAIASLDNPAVGIYCRGLGGPVSGRILPHDRRSEPWAAIMGRKEDIDALEKLMDKLLPDKVYQDLEVQPLETELKGIE